MALLSLTVAAWTSACSDETFSGGSGGTTSSGSGGTTNSGGGTTSSGGGSGGSSSGTGGSGGSSSGTGGSGGSSSGTAGAGGEVGGAGGSSSGQGGFDPAQDPTAQINHPGDGECRVVNQQVPFVGVATDPQDGALSGGSLVWTCSIDGQIGTGLTFNFTPTQIGTHIITLTATDSDQNVGTDQVTLDIQAQCN